MNSHFRKYYISLHKWWISVWTTEFASDKKLGVTTHFSLLSGI